LETEGPKERPKAIHKIERCFNVAGLKMQSSVVFSKQLAGLLKGHTRQSLHHLGGVAITKVTKKVAS